MSASDRLSVAYYHLHKVPSPHIQGMNENDRYSPSLFRANTF